MPTIVRACASVTFGAPHVCVTSLPGVWTLIGRRGGGQSASRTR